ncbi:MAG TPA: DAK2 domain-containing protein [Acholeplasmataceae bacterium]|nr:DAK2 domain-containing protein [Acholeplasmataceae bacterium]
MQIDKLGGALFKTIVINGAENLRLNYQEVDALNVFPVPDGDTGTNMRMTIEGGVSEIAELNEESLSEVSKKLSRGMLMGARGNSGVILSQIFRGISRVFDGHESADAMLLAKAFSGGVSQAYKAVMKPVEGTILTVARKASEKLLQISSSRMTINEFFKEFIDEARITLLNTPNLLPVLKEAGVVDSGGAGLVYILEGMMMALDGNYISSSAKFEGVHIRGKAAAKASEDHFGYCTEFIIQIEEDKIDLYDETQVVDSLKELGSSIVAVKDEDLIKVHIHSLNPGEVLNRAQKFGEFIKLKIENMSIQHNESPDMPHPPHDEHQHITNSKKDEKRKKYAIVAVASGEGLIKTFEELGVDYVVKGGQSMNPSTEDFIKGFDTLNAENIIVFPNNGNIILAAKQSAKIYDESKIWIVETKSLAQGFSALTMLDLNGEPQEIIDDLAKVINNVTTGLITYSIRETNNKGLHIKKDDFIAICNGDIIAAHRSRYETLKKLLEESITEEKEIVTIIYGKDTNKREIDNIVRHIEKNYSDVEVDVICGDQEVYSYILAIE